MAGLLTPPHLNGMSIKEITFLSLLLFIIFPGGGGQNLFLRASRANSTGPRGPAFFRARIQFWTPGIILYPLLKENVRFLVEFCLPDAPNGNFFQKFLNYNFFLKSVCLLRISVLLQLCSFVPEGTFIPV